MKKLLLVYLALLVASVALAQRFPPGPLVSSKKAAAGGGAYLVNQNFEGTGYDNGETWTESAAAGTWDEDYSSAPLLGSQSLNGGGVTIGSTYTSYSGQTTVYAFCKYWNDLEPSSDRSIFSIRNSSGAVLAALIVGTTGNIYLEANGSQSSASGATVARDTIYNVWVTFVSGGTCELAMSTSTTKPTTDGSGSGGNVFLTRTGASDTASRIYCDNWDSQSIFDHVLVSTSAIGNNP